MTEDQWPCVCCEEYSDVTEPPIIVHGQVLLVCSECDADNLIPLHSFAQVKHVLPFWLADRIQQDIDRLMEVKKWIDSIAFQWKANRIPMNDLRRKQFLQLKYPDLRKIVAGWETERLQRLRKNNIKGKK